MIGWLSGKLKHRDPDGRLILDVHGVGYLVSVPLSVGAQTELGSSLELWIHTHVREDDLALFGFEDEVQLQTFRALTDVSGVGPKVALGVLSQTPPSELAAAVAEQDIARLSKAKGVGKRLAERLAVELKGKLDFVPVSTIAASGSKPTKTVGRKSPKDRVIDDFRSALGNLGYRPKEVDAVLLELGDEVHESTDFSALVRRALSILKK